MVTLTILFATMLSFTSYRMVMLRMKPVRRGAPRMLSISQFPLAPLAGGGLGSRYQGRAWR